MLPTATRHLLAATMGPDGTFATDGRPVVFQAPMPEYWDNDDTRQCSLAPAGMRLRLMRRLRPAAGASAIRLILREHVVPGEDSR